MVREGEMLVCTVVLIRLGWTISSSLMPVSAYRLIALVGCLAKPERSTRYMYEACRNYCISAENVSYQVLGESFVFQSFPSVRHPYVSGQDQSIIKFYFLLK